MRTTSKVAIPTIVISNLVRVREIEVVFCKELLVVSEVGTTPVTLCGIDTDERNGGRWARDNSGRDEWVRSQSAGLITC